MEQEAEILETFQQQAFEVRFPDETFDPQSEPQSGEEFLMKVIYERRNCPAVVTKHQKNGNCDNIQLSKIPMNEINDISPTSLRPTKEWKEIQAMDFIATRNKINELRRELKAHDYSTEHEFPLTEEEHEWVQFCQNNPPLLSTILRINQRSLERLLEFQSEWLIGDEEVKRGEKTDDEPNNQENATTSMVVDLTGKEEWLGAWIYSTLACLSLPLEPDVYSILRNIARTCIRLRNKLGENDETKAAPYNLFISIICMVFNQLDFGEYI